MKYQGDKLIEEVGNEKNPTKVLTRFLNFEIYAASVDIKDL